MNKPNHRLEKVAEESPAEIRETYSFARKRERTGDRTFICSCDDDCCCDRYCQRNCDGHCDCEDHDPSGKQSCLDCESYD